jgi:hypothetical protein
LHASVTSLEIAQETDLCAVVDVLDCYPRNQAMDWQVRPVVSWSQLKEVGAGVQSCHCGDVAEVVVVSGAPGAGKSTRAAPLARALGSRSSRRM